MIVKTPNICGGAARVDGTRVPVWVLDNYARLGGPDIGGAYPHLSAEQIKDALDYANRNRDEIDELIRLNER